jgi:hypothetical protein
MTSSDMRIMPKLFNTVIMPKNNTNISNIAFDPARSYVNVLKEFDM